MKKIDIFFAVICGLSVAWIAHDFHSFFGNYAWTFFFILPILSVVGLWLVDLIGKKYLFVRQGGKFVLAGAFADVIDIKVFQLLFWLLPWKYTFKVISFFVSTLVKYYSDKYWSFEQNEKKDMSVEMAKFFFVAIVGSVLNVVSFYYLGKIRTGLPENLWTELSIILAAIASGLWNFLGYKFIVFKK